MDTSKGRACKELEKAPCYVKSDLIMVEGKDSDHDKLINFLIWFYSISNLTLCDNILANILDRFLGIIFNYFAFLLWNSFTNYFNQGFRNPDFQHACTITSFTYPLNEAFSYIIRGSTLAFEGEAMPSNPLYLNKWPSPLQHPGWSPFNKLKVIPWDLWKEDL